jgi:microcystin-dependent protein
MADPFVGEIRMFAFNFPPTGWAYCNGQLMPISQNTALFSILGTFYGGDGKSTFALPDLQGRVPLHQGQGQGLVQRFLGEESGTEAVTLLSSEMPAHNHQMQAHALDGGDVQLPSAQSLFAASVGGKVYQPTPTPGKVLALQALAPVGGDQPHNNLQPYLALNFCIALQGIFPPRQ